MTTKELIEKIDGTTRGEIIEQAYDLGFKDGYEMGSHDSFDPETSECLKELYSKTEHKIDNKPNPPMPKDYDKFTFNPDTLKIFNYPKHVIVNGALYELIDESPLTVVSGYHGGV